MKIKQVTPPAFRSTQEAVEYTLAELVRRLDKWKHAQIRLAGTVEKYRPEPGSDGGLHLAATLDGWSKRVISDALNLATAISAYSDLMRG